MLRGVTSRIQQTSHATWRHIPEYSKLHTLHDVTSPNTANFTRYMTSRPEYSKLHTLRDVTYPNTANSTATAVRTHTCPSPAGSSLLLVQFLTFVEWNLRCGGRNRFCRGRRMFTGRWELPSPEFPAHRRRSGVGVVIPGVDTTATVTVIATASCRCHARTPSHSRLQQQHKCFVTNACFGIEVYV
jgi:hypothetical protein